MNTYVCVHTYICNPLAHAGACAGRLLYVGTYVDVRTYTYVQVRTYIYIDVRRYMHVVHVRILAYAYVRTYRYMYVGTCTLYTHVLMFVNIHKYVRTRSCVRTCIRADAPCCTYVQALVGIRT